MTLRNATWSDWPAIVALNLASVEQLSPMDEDRLALYASQACYLRVVVEHGEVLAFLLAFRKGSGYRGAVFQALQSHAGDFIYLDRVAVHERARGRGLASELYEDLAAAARAERIPALLCEVYLTNESSLRFHHKRGFREFGRMESHGKTVSLLKRRL
ncbi:MAG: GNAT family N-acetyltransferase [Alphaproteobacteria bacterium]|nr:GNAT family N-acetyltransferase [Alphaproteobacteria bacterium]MBL6939556.1 GNAT family N-acetyltransferase [Alphaproteobacteria bacterium]MBL7100071.1 GNAT family N-acetyltransferase [Alphaproteobacteria bacterium]